MAPQHPPFDGFLYSDGINNHSGAEDNYSAAMDRNINDILQSLPGGKPVEISNEEVQDLFFDTMTSFDSHGESGAD